MAASEKMGLGDWRYRDEAGGVCHSVGVHRGSEDGNLVVWRPEGFYSFEYLLSIVQARCHSVYSKEGVFDKLWLGPLPGFRTVV